MKPILPFVATTEEMVEKVVKYAQVKPGQKSVDLGAGDGRLVIAMAEAGALAYGFEIQTKYARRAKANIALAGLRGKAFVSEVDFWEEDLSRYDIVTIYCMAILMERLSEKLTNELRPGTVVISNGFQIPNWTPIKEDTFLYMYVKE